METATTTTTTDDTITNKPPLPGMGVSDPPDILLPEDNNTSTAPLPRQRKSSFHDELLSHFEKRLSDLGPRNQYPYLQQIDRSQRETGLAGHSLGGGSNVGGAVDQENGGTGGKEGAWKVVEVFK